MIDQTCRAGTQNFVFVIPDVSAPLFNHSTHGRVGMLGCRVSAACRKGAEEKGAVITAGVLQARTLSYLMLTQPERLGFALVLQMNRQVTHLSGIYM